MYKYFMKTQILEKTQLFLIQYVSLECKISFMLFNYAKHYPKQQKQK